MHKPRRLMTAAALAAAAVLAAPAGAEAVQSAATATGGIALAGPPQYASFAAFDYGDSGDRGTVTYTNFTYADPGSGVWALATHSTVVFTLGGDYPHSMVIDSIQPTGNAAYTFSGHGAFDPNPAYTWTVTGSVAGTTVTLHIVYTGAEAGYYLDAVGEIQADGSVLGTSFSDSYGRSLTWRMPTGSAGEVLSYTATIMSAVVADSSASFSYVIPAGTGLEGMHVTMTVTDGGSPGAGNDTYGHNGSTYPITAGNLVVH